MRSTRTDFVLLMPILLAIAPSTSSARAHEATNGPCTLLSNPTDSQTIDPSVAVKRGIAVGSEVAVIDVTMICKGHPGNGTVAADIDATRTDLVGTSEAIVMHIDRQNGMSPTTAPTTTCPVRSCGWKSSRRLRILPDISSSSISTDSLPDDGF